MKNETLRQFPSLLERCYCFVYWRLLELAALFGENELVNKFKASLIMGGIVGMLILNSYLWSTRLLLSSQLIQKFESPLVVVLFCLVTFFALDRTLCRRYSECRSHFKEMGASNLGKKDLILGFFVLALLVGSVVSIHVLRQRFSIGS